MCFICSPFIHVGMSVRCLGLQVSLCINHNFITSPSHHMETERMAKDPSFEWKFVEMKGFFNDYVDCRPDVFGPFDCKCSMLVVDGL